MKIEQKMDTGGNNKTSTPILNPRRNFSLFDPDNAARHIEHCALASNVSANKTPTTSRIINVNRQLDFVTVPPPAPGRQAVLLQIYIADRMSENYPGKTQTTNRYRRPASVQLLRSGLAAQTSGA